MNNNGMDLTCLANAGNAFNAYQKASLYINGITDTAINNILKDVAIADFLFNVYKLEGKYRHLMEQVAAFLAVMVLTKGTGWYNSQRYPDFSVNIVEQVLGDPSISHPAGYAIYANGRDKPIFLLIDNRKASTVDWIVHNLDFDYYISNLNRYKFDCIQDAIIGSYTPDEALEAMARRMGYGENEDC